MNIPILVCAWLDIHQHQSQLLIGRHQVLIFIAPNATLAPAA